MDGRVNWILAMSRFRIGNRRQQGNKGRFYIMGCEDFVVFLKRECVLNEGVQKGAGRIKTKDGEGKYA